MTLRLFKPSAHDLLEDERAEREKLAEQLRQAHDDIIRLQTTVQRQQEQHTITSKEIGAIREQNGHIAAANEAQREALKTQRILIDELRAETAGMHGEIERLQRFASAVQEENAALRNDVLFWWSIARAYKIELADHGIVKREIEHNGIKC
jgi:FtsZ-binding cell division protein ZapB